MPGIPPIETYPIPGVGDLPDNIATWTPNPERTVLLIHDMQRFFLRPLPAPTRDELVRTISLLRERATALGVQIAYSTQPGDMSEEERGLLRDFWGPGMSRTPDDRLVTDELYPEVGDWMFFKRRYSAFFGCDLLERIRLSGRDQLIICGVYAHLGVLITAVEAYSNDLQTFVVGDAVADFSADHHHMALRYVASSCAAVISAKEVFL
ncbi:isochorismatase family protein [Actinomadura sp. 7K507]|uniref:isochorismatase family protein n=1 Tax=Actinomadura sp. 7K507 TaxID=2530365 RepID=UPI0010465D61|nr:isochorismatase family protein [Actinomadura sp. 7K507]TDC98386.1 isochorismatase family protein [Actinomadura sp. 7K507]